jgi:hypothetical protein
MSLYRRTARAFAALPLLLLAAAPVAAAPAACSGAGWVAPNFATLESRVVGNMAQITFEYSGQHPLCLENGTQVTAAVAGRLWESLGTDGSVGIRFSETLSYGGGTLGFSGDATFGPAGWHSHVRTNGSGTGLLSGMRGEGSFSPINPNTGAFTDTIAYTYH